MCGPTILIQLLKKFINHLKEILYKKDINMTKIHINIKIKFLKNVKQKIPAAFKSITYISRTLNKGCKEWEHCTVVVFSLVTQSIKS